MYQPELENPVTIRRCSSHRQAEHYALVLTAMGMQSSIVSEDGSFELRVAREDAPRANDEITAYERENPAQRPGKATLPTARPSVEAVMAHWAVLLFFFAAARRDALSLEWVDIGAARAGSMLRGEWWRAITAMCLHVDSAHLLGNLVFGTVILWLLARVTGTGVAGLSMVVAGALGNVANALVQPAHHGSIGASTAIFAGIGVLAALRQVWRAGRGRLSLRDWVPLAGGVTLLVFLGLSGENTDIIGHVLGFVAGIAVGRVMIEFDPPPVHRGLQRICGASTVLLVTAAWLLAALG